MHRARVRNVVVVALGVLSWGGAIEARATDVLASWLERARAGEVEAQRRVGGAYYHGRNVERDFGEAARWWERAALQGDVESAYELGTLYRRGKGVEADPFAAARWMRMARDEREEARRYLEQLESSRTLVELDAEAAYVFHRVDAEAGVASAQRLVGLMLRDGRGVTRSPGEAAMWLEKAATQGDVEAQGALGSLFDEGDGVARDPLRALVWFEKAAQQGHSGAQFNLGSMLLHGNGVPADPVEAVMWLTLCSDEVYSARYLLHSEHERIDPADLAKGKALAAARRTETIDAAEPAASSEP